MPVFDVARLTFDDLVRRRVFVILALFAAGLILLSFPLRQLTIGQWSRLITDVGLAATDASLTLLAVLLGASLLAGDLERRTLYPLLAKPLSRQSFVIGKFVGLAAVLALLAVVMTSGIGAMLLLAKQTVGAPLLQAGIGLLMNGVLVGGIAIFFSSFTSTTLAGTFGLAVTVIGHLTGQLDYFGSKAHSAVAAAVLRGLAKVLPNLELLNLKTLAAHARMISWPEFGVRTGYGFAYTGLVVALGAVIFSRRDLK